MKRCADTFLIRIGNSAAKFLAVVIFLCFFLCQNYSFKPDVNLVQLHIPGQTVLNQKREEKNTFKFDRNTAEEVVANRS